MVVNVAQRCEAPRYAYQNPCHPVAHRGLLCSSVQSENARRYVTGAKFIRLRHPVAQDKPVALRLAPLATLDGHDRAARAQAHRLAVGIGWLSLAHVLLLFWLLVNWP